ncbi:MAG TPA: Bax inhibitor-1/YccA family protein [Tenuifilaceae bacterium]|nr:Bax inhibitor-1/YccA family protein [Tenuifilaceae bacterium]HPE18777.1 Bax inhibitor-1/YccA family protein [Tenuifilaceae bacterium]HPJ46065.1 Bax inhibitor-1/YccA family protein [Tenuifilaceae bacterium]HPQ34237.1 Bax inhibitor-1/YccA family protein [Tenuifilaceae bacterium]HRX68831.1 Bax inhibitor-1/YccA family protein [Tenuifilaceae bacterium]
MFKSSNPALSEQIFAKTRTEASSEVMTVQGTMGKALLMLALVVLGAVYTWRSFFMGGNPTIWMMVGGIGGFITALITAFSPKTSPISAPIYAILEGLLLGGLSAFMAAQYTGNIVIQAVGLTFSTFFLMLFLYRSGIVKVTAKFRMGVFAATGAIALMYLVSFIAGLFGANFGFIHDGGTLSIIVSLIIVGVAALNLALDFDFIERGAAMGSPKYMEWYGAFGLMVTLVWLYIEFLKLLAKFSRRN